RHSNTTNHLTRVHHEVGGRTRTATPPVLREGPERDRLYAALADYRPDLREYGPRTFPVVRLDPAE
ncbi:hypothetical protein, partial [Pseudonocardia alaniniphila]